VSQPTPRAPATQGGHAKAPQVAECDALAATAVQLALSFPTWVRRRKWTFTYIDDTTLREQLSVCFRLPGDSELVLAAGLATILVPLWIPNKVLLTNVDARDEIGAAISIVSARETVEAAVGGLYLIFKAEALGTGARFDDKAVLEALRAIITAPYIPIGRPGHDQLGQLVKANREIIQRSTGLPRDERFELLDELAEGFLLMVPVAYDPGRDRVLKVSFDAAHAWHPGGGSRGQKLWFSGLASLGLREKEQAVAHGFSIGQSISSHFQVAAPPDVDLAKAWLEVGQYDPEDPLQNDSEHPAPSLPRVCRKPVVDRPVAELNVGVKAQWDFACPPQPEPEPGSSEAAQAEAAYRDLLACRGDRATLWVRFALPTRGVFVVACVVSLLSAAMLLVASLRLTQFDRQASGSLLLALPGALAAYLARPGEHAFATRLLAGVRFCALAVGVCALIVAALIQADLTRAVVQPEASLHGVRCHSSTLRRARSGHSVPARLRISCAGGVTQPAPGSPQATSTARAVAFVCTAVASALTVLLCCGLARTFRADLKRRAKTETAAQTG
jgi:hypothetical protein